MESKEPSTNTLQYKNANSANFIFSCAIRNELCKYNPLMRTYFQFPIS